MRSFAKHLVSLLTVLLALLLFAGAAAFAEEAYTAGVDEILKELDAEDFPDEGANSTDA